MKQVIVLMILFGNLLFAQDILISYKYSNVVSDNITNTVSMEGVYLFDNKIIAVGTVLGYANLVFNDYFFEYSPNDKNVSKLYYGLVLYYFPLHSYGNPYSLFNLSIEIAKIGKAIFPSGGMFLGTGFHSPGTTDDYISNLLIGIKPKEKGLKLFGQIGVQYRRYKESVLFRNDDFENFIYSYNKNEISFLLNLGFQFTF